MKEENDMTGKSLTEIKKMKNLVSKETTDNNVIVTLDNFEYIYFPFKMELNNFKDEKILKSFINSIKKNVRSSKIYSAHIDRLKKMGLKHCAYFSRINDEMTDIEFHHGPFLTMEDYCKIVLNKQLDENNGVSTFSVAKELLFLHYLDKILMIPLCKDVHLTVHNNGNKNIKPQFVDYRSGYGDIVWFLENYGKYFDVKHKNKVFQYFEEFNERLKNNDFDSEYFDPKIMIFKQKK